MNIPDPLGWIVVSRFRARFDDGKKRPVDVDLGLAPGGVFLAVERLLAGRGAQA